MANNILLDILTRGNRPYALNDIVKKCGKELSEAAIKKSLLALVAQQQVRTKCAGKQQIYFIQSTTNNGSNKTELRREFELCKKRCEQTQLNIKLKQSKCHELEMKLNTLAKVRSFCSLETERVELLDELRALNERLRRSETTQMAAAAAAVTGGDVDDDDVDAIDNFAMQKLAPTALQCIEQNYEHVAQAYRKRKRLCADIVDAIMEGYPNSKRALIDDIGIETDEMAKFQMDLKR